MCLRASLSRRRAVVRQRQKAKSRFEVKDSDQPQTYSTAPNIVPAVANVPSTVGTPVLNSRQSTPLVSLLPDISSFPGQSLAKQSFSLLSEFCSMIHALALENEVLRKELVLLKGKAQAGLQPRPSVGTRSLSILDVVSKATTPMANGTAFLPHSQITSAVSSTVTQSHQNQGQHGQISHIGINTVQSVPKQYEQGKSSAQSSKRVSPRVTAILHSQPHCSMVVQNPVLSSAVIAHMICSFSEYGSGAQEQKVSYPTLPGNGERTLPIMNAQMLTSELPGSENSHSNIRIDQELKPDLQQDSPSCYSFHGASLESMRSIGYHKVLPGDAER
ncbi:hypothetical protein FGB62_57g21 [Gracilaria domingensis]|nr:hypothetical protein FGB62_57g21 [Gracilaria domingensis]